MPESATILGLGEVGEATSFLGSLITQIGSFIRSIASQVVQYLEEFLRWIVEFHMNLLKERPEWGITLITIYMYMLL